MSNKMSMETQFFKEVSDSSLLADFFSSLYNF